MEKETQKFGKAPTAADIKKYLKTMDKEEMEQVLQEVFKRTPKNKKLIFKLMLEAAHNHSEMPSKDAIIPNFSEIDKNIEFIYRNTIYTSRWYIRLSMKQKLRRLVKDMIEQLINCPENVPDYELVINKMEWVFAHVCLVDNDESTASIDLWPVSVSMRDFFRTIVSRTLALGFSRERLKDLFLFATTVTENKDFVQMELQEILISQLKTGDLRYEFLEMMEEWLKNVNKNLFENRSEEYIRRYYEHAWLLGTQYLFLAKKEIGEKSGISFLEKDADPQYRSKFQEAVEKFQAYQRQDELDESGKSEFEKSFIDFM